MVRYTVDKGDIIFPSKGADRLHHGLSETILVNTRTDVREFKKSIYV